MMLYTNSPASTWKMWDQVGGGGRKYPLHKVKKKHAIPEASNFMEVLS